MDKTIKTRLTKGGDVHETALTIDFADVTREQLEELAARTIVISTQAIYRTAKSVPAHDTVVVVDMLKRERVGAKSTPESIAKKVAKMSDVDRAALIKLMQATIDAGK